MTAIQGDSRYTWAKRPGALSHAIPADKDGRKMTTLCGLRVGRLWVKAKGEGHPCYRPKCPSCRLLARRADRTLARVRHRLRRQLARTREALEQLEATV